jgi:MurNAc alpha-1-phosphate uridylyltransferase
MNEALDSRGDLDIIISHEPELLDTGGGIKNVLHHFGDMPFFVINADLPWLDHGPPALKRLANAWDTGRMDVLLLLQDRNKARGFGDRGDFMMETDGRVYRHDTVPPYPYVMMAAQIMKPELFVHIPGKIFSNNVIWDEAEKKKRLFGIEHHGTSYHVGTPGDFQEANRLLTSGQGWG